MTAQVALCAIFTVLEGHADHVVTAHLVRSGSEHREPLVDRLRIARDVDLAEIDVRTVGGTAAIAVQPIMANANAEARMTARMESPTSNEVGSRCERRVLDATVLTDT